MAALMIGALVSITQNGKIRTSKYEVRTAKLKSAVRVALVSDLHARKFDENNDQLVERVAESEPDIICVGGDMLEGHLKNEQFPDLLSLIERFADIAPVYYVPGNHDYSIYGNDVRQRDGEFIGYERLFDDVLVELNEAGATFLESEHLDIEVKGQKLRLGGFYPLASRTEYDTDETYNKRIRFLEEYEDTDAFKLMISHRPDSFVKNDAYKGRDIDLVLCGHTHGGVLRLPLVGAIWTSEGFFPEHDMGEFDLDGMKMIITSGLNGYNRIPRVYNPPEIAVIDLVPEE